MALQISDECLACGVCMDECPVEAITEGDDMFIINPDECTDCGACSEVCPSEAISESKVS